MKGENYLIVSDLQIPFEASGALEFCRSLKEQYKIPDENCLCVGDEVDQYFGSMYLHDPDATHTPSSEIYLSIKRMREWYKAFPKMKVCESNHGQRWAKKASAAGIPSIMMRLYQEVLQAPSGWMWARKWQVNASAQPFMVMHGMGYSGQSAFRQMAVNNGMSTVHGHLHANAGIAYVKTEGADLWGMNCGSLIDVNAYAFHYAKDHKFKPFVGTGLVLEGGRLPVLIPLTGRPSLSSSPLP